jgi:hypothetical protein
MSYLGQDRECVKKRRVTVIIIEVPHRYDLSIDKLMKIMKHQPHNNTVDIDMKKRHFTFIDYI